MKSLVLYPKLIHRSIRAASDRRYGKGLTESARAWYNSCIEKEFYSDKRGAEDGQRQKETPAHTIVDARSADIDGNRHVCAGKYSRGCGVFLRPRITRGLGFLFSRATNYIPVSFYEWTAVLLIAGGITLLVFLVVLLCRKKFAQAGVCLYRLAVAVLSVLLAFGVLYAPLYERESSLGALGLSEAVFTEEKLYEAAEYYVASLNEVSAEL